MANKEIIVRNYLEAKAIWDNILAKVDSGRVTDWDALDAEMDVAYEAFHKAEVALLDSEQEVLNVAGIDRKALRGAETELKERVFELLVQSALKGL